MGWAQPVCNVTYIEWIKALHTTIALYTLSHVYTWNHNVLLWKLIFCLILCIQMTENIPPTPYIVNNNTYTFTLYPLCYTTTGGWLLNDKCLGPNENLYLINLMKWLIIGVTWSLKTFNVRVDHATGL